MALNSNALITLEELKGYLGIDAGDTSKDLLLEMYINGISDYIQGVGQSILATDYTEKYKGTGTQNLILKHKPINSVTLVKNKDSEVTDYEILSPIGILYRDYGWVAYGDNGGLMHDRLVNSYKTIEVEYNAGYNSTPSDLLMVIVDVIKKLEEDNQTGNLKSYQISDVQKTWKEEVKSNKEYTSIIKKYRGINI